METRKVYTPREIGAEPGANIVDAETAALLDAHEHFDIRTIGAWGVPISIRAVAMECDGFDAHSTMIRPRVIGLRTMHDLRESGYSTDGRVSVRGVKRSAFTSDLLYQRPDGTLGKCAIIHVRAVKR